MDSIGNIHFHVGGIAIMDVLFTIVGAGILSRRFKWSFPLTLGILFLLGIFFHRVFGVRTTVDKWLFKD